MSYFLSAKFKQEGCKVIKINLGMGILSYLLLPRLYFQYLTFTRCDVVILNSGSGTALWLKILPAILIGRLLGTRVVLRFAGGAAVDTARTWGVHKRLPFRLAHIVIVPTERLKKALTEQNIHAHFVVIPNVVDVDLFSRTNNHHEQNILLATKSLSAFAGYELLLEVFEAVQQRVPSARFWIIGEGPLRNELEARVVQKGLRGVRFWGNVEHDDVPGFMQQAKVFVHGTRYEAFGIALGEALAAGLPVVAFSVGGIPEVVPDGRAGYLVRYGDVEAFISRIVNLLSDEQQYAAFSQFGRIYSKRFDWQALKSQWFAACGIDAQICE